MKGFWARLVQLNAQFLVKALREAATQIEISAPGTPVIAFLHFTSGGKAVQNPTVKDNQAPFDASATYLDAAGNPTTPDDIPVWSSDNEAVATVSATPDGLGATVTIVGGLGAAIISSDSTNEAGDDIKAQGTITVVASDAVTAQIDFNVPATA